MADKKEKKLVWKNVNPEVFQDWSCNAEVAVLKLNGKPAYYEVQQMNGNEITCKFFYGNQGVSIDDDWKRYASLEEAQEACQQHYHRLVVENSTI